MFLLVIATFLGGGIIAIIAMTAAPEGFEDVTGFHVAPAKVPRSTGHAEQDLHLIGR